MVAGVPVEDHKKLVLQVKALQETLGETQSAMDSMRDRIQLLEHGLTRSEAHADLLIRLNHSGSKPSSSAQAPPSPRGKDPDMA